jgi:hypothetical protein
MAEKKTAKKAPFLMYKGKPLVRCGNIIYYGDMADRYVIMMQVMSTKQTKGEETAGTVLVELISTDIDLRARDRIIKKTEKEGLYNALDIGCIWLERALEE